MSAAPFRYAKAIRLEDELGRRGIQLKRIGAELVAPVPSAVVVTDLPFT